jgi:hypothetical protein
MLRYSLLFPITVHPLILTCCAGCVKSRNVLIASILTASALLEAKMSIMAALTSLTVSLPYVPLTNYCPPLQYLLASSISESSSIRMISTMRARIVQCILPLIHRLPVEHQSCPNTSDIMCAGSNIFCHPSRFFNNAFHGSNGLVVQNSTLKTQ